MKGLLANAVNGLLVVCALLVTGLVVRREFFGASPAAAGETVADWSSYAAQGQRAGPADAPVTVVVFSDFQCPACASLAERMKEVRARHPGQVAMVFRHFPLPNHAAAVPAARASECAAAQGRFEALHDLFFAQQDSLGTKPWARFAREAGVADLAAFGRCMQGRDADAAVRRDSEAGMRLGLSATPTLLINGRRVQGAPPLPRLEQLINDELERAR
jgi:protein-disulfide isomerase